MSLMRLARIAKAPGPLQTAGRGSGSRVRTGLARVESRDWVTATRVLQGFPRALVAPADGTRTTDVAVLLPTVLTADVSTVASRTAFVNVCCGTQRDRRASPGG